MSIGKEKYIANSISFPIHLKREYKLDNRMTDKTKYNILDTNILLTDPKKALYDSFKPKEGATTYLILPIVVIEELDKFKHEKTERGRNARQASGILKKLKQKSDTSFSQGIKLEDNYFLRVVTGLEHEIEQQFKKAEDDVRRAIPSGDSSTKFDNRILTIAMAYHRQYSSQNCQKKNVRTTEVELITQDTNLMIKAAAFGVQANDWEDLHAIKKDEKIYKGYQEIILPGQTYEKLTKQLREHELRRDKSYLRMDHNALSITDCFPNEFFRLTNEANQEEALLAKNTSSNGGVMVFAKCISKEADKQEIISYKKRYPITGITPRNYQQAFAIEALLDRNIKLVHLIGPAGSGKTLLALAVGLHCKQNINEDLEFLVTKPVVPVGQSLGSLPGTQEEKQMPWMQGINDNLNLLCGGNAKELFDDKVIEIQALETIRGRSIHDGFYIVDEAQNVTPKEVEAIITRMGDTSKVIIVGDPDQVDHPALNFFSTGLLHSSEIMKDEELSATIYLSKGERSRLATIASKKFGQYRK